MRKPRHRASALKAVQDAVKICGTQVKFAKLCGVTQPTVASWMYRGLPAERVLVVEKATGVSRHDLRPDLYPRPVPEPRHADLLNAPEAQP